MKPAIASTWTPVTAISGAYTTSSAAHTRVPLASLVVPTTLSRSRVMLSLMRMRVRLERRRDPAVADDKGIAHHRTSEVSRAQPVDRVGVPDPADVEPVAARGASSSSCETGSAPSTTTLEAADARRAVELAAAARAEAEAVARDERRRGGRRRWPRACRPARDRAAAAACRTSSSEGRPAAVADQVGAAGRQALAGDALGAHEARHGAVVVDRSRGEATGGRAGPGTAWPRRRTPPRCTPARSGCS